MTPIDKAKFDALLGLTNELVKSTHFLSEDDHAVFETCKSNYTHLYSVTGDYRNLTRLCILYNKRFKRLTPEVMDVALEALRCGGHPDAVVYYCKAVIVNLTGKEASSCLSAAKEIVVGNKNSYDLFKIFEACLFWTSGDMSGYTSSLKEFWESKNRDFNPYISIPASTAWLHSYAPSVSNSEQGKAAFHYRTRQPDYEPAYIISVSCDSQYFKRYSDVFLKSLATIADNFYCHVSLVDQVDDRMPDGRFVLVNQNLRTQSNIGPVASSLRFLHAYELLNNHSCPVVVMDFDTGIRKSIKPLLGECSDVDAGLRIENNVLPWEAIMAGFSIFNPAPKSKAFLDTVGGFLLSTLRLDVSQWWVDQNALECGARFSKKEGFVHKNIKIMLPEYVVIPIGSHDSKIAQLKAAI